MGPPPAEPTNDNRRFDIHDALGQIARAEARLRSVQSGIPTETARTILEFVEARRAAVSSQRTVTYLWNLQGAAKQLGPDLLEPNRDTPTKFLRLYRGKEVWTKITVRSVLYSFWKWRLQREGKDFPPWLKIPLSTRGASRKDHNDVLAPGEVARIAEHAINLRDKALVWVLYESGGRIGEVLALRIGDVERTEYGAVRLYFPTGKTGRRTVPLFEAAVPNLLLWLKNHPRADDRDAPLWVPVEQPSPSSRGVGYRYVVKLLERAAARAGIKKPVNPHSFRHSRATAVAQNPQISTAVLEKFFGWQPGSPMAKTYVHLSGKEVEDALARAHGIELGKAETPRARLPRVCARCSTSNEPDGKFCVQCGGPLSLEGAEERARWKSEEDALADILDDPKVRGFIARRLKIKLARATT
ncbi:MAG: tyrosine-type recombinase/integrase [Thermoplasmata archaeon]